MKQRLHRISRIILTLFLAAALALGLPAPRSYAALDHSNPQVQQLIDYINENTNYTQGENPYYLIGDEAGSSVCYQSGEWEQLHFSSWHSNNGQISLGCFFKDSPCIVEGKRSTDSYIYRIRQKPFATWGDDMNMTGFNPDDMSNIGWVCYSGSHKSVTREEIAAFNDELKKAVTNWDNWLTATLDMNLGDLGFTFEEGIHGNPGNTDDNSLAVGDIFSAGQIEYRITSDTTVALVRVKGGDTSYVIPETVQYTGNTYTVKEISSEAFARIKTVETVTIPASVETIGKKAFVKCKKLKTITINAESLKSVGKNAFKKIANNATVTITGGDFDAAKNMISKASNTELKIIKGE